MPVNAEGTLIAFATGDNRTADDNIAEANGLYTKFLIPALLTPGLQLREAFQKTKEDVYAASRTLQNPSIYENVIGAYYLVAPPAVPVTVVAPNSFDLALRAELTLWEAVRDSRSTAAFNDYLGRYPQGQFTQVARARLDELRSPPPQVTQSPSQSQLTPGPGNQTRPTQARSGTLQW